MEHSLRDGKAGTDGWEDGESEPTQVARLARSKAAKKPASPADDPHDVLGVRRGASASEIRAAYLRLVKELHPDGRASDTDAEEADQRLRAINEAYKKLKVWGKGAGTSGAERRTARRRAGVIFVVSALASAAPAFAILVIGFYYAGWLAPVPDTGRTPDAMSAYTKDPSVGRQSAFADAQKEGTKEAWARFLAAYAEGEPADKARQAIAALEKAEAGKRERIAWNAAEKGTKEALQRFLAAYPDGEHAPKARQALAALELALARKLEERTAWGVAEKQGTKEAIERFMAGYPDSEHTPLARQALAAIAAAEAELQADLAAWTAAERAGDKAALHNYLSAFPSGRHADEAKQRVALLEDIEEREKDDAAWLKARQRNTKAAYADYLASHPLGFSAAAARGRIAKLEQAEAKAEQAKARAGNQTKVAASIKSSPPPAAKDGAMTGEPWPTADEPFVGPDGRIRR